MSATTLRNAWMRHDLEYFPRANAVPDNVNVNDVSVSTVPENVNDVSAMSDGGMVVSDLLTWTDGDGDTDSDGDGDADLDADI